MRDGEILKEQGYHAYEVSNYAKPGQESQHNLIYWRYNDYIGVGPGAHGRYKNLQGQKIATRCLRGPDQWMDAVLKAGRGLQASEPLSSQDQAAEMIMMGLRLEEGIDHSRFEMETGEKLIDYIAPSKINKLISEGYIIPDSHHLKLTGAGRRNLNAVLGYFL